MGWISIKNRRRKPKVGKTAKKEAKPTKKQKIFE